MRYLKLFVIAEGTFNGVGVSEAELFYRVFQPKILSGLR